jgi:sulfane dehydrogenase subunit SoxC
MNGEALRPEHGAPARLVVPGWYAVASVNWLRSVHLLEQHEDST